MSDHETLTVDVNGFATRVWRKGSGPKLGFLAGFGGLPRWVPFLDELAKSRTVIVPSLPGFPGGDRGHSVLDTISTGCWRCAKFWPRLDSRALISPAVLWARRWPRRWRPCGPPACVVWR